MVDDSSCRPPDLPQGQRAARMKSEGRAGSFNKTRAGVGKRIRWPYKPSRSKEPNEEVGPQPEEQHHPHPPGTYATSCLT